MIVRIHAGVAPHLVSIPPLPHGGGAMVHQIPPRGILSVEQQVISNIAVTCINQHRQQIRRTQKAGCQLAAIGLYLGDKFFARCITQPIGHQMHIQRQHVAGLRIAPIGLGLGIVDLPKWRGTVICPGDKSVGMNELVVEGGLDFAEQGIVLCLIFRLAQGVCHLLHQRDIVSPIGGGHQRLARWPFR